MLPADSRLTEPEGFRRVTRAGRRSGSSTVVTHLLAASGEEVSVLSAGAGHAPPRVGFVVSKAVGGAVVRNRVKRRLRHLVAGLLADLPPGSLLVVRANPAAALASYQEMGRDLRRCLARAGVGSAA